MNIYKKLFWALSVKFPDISRFSMFSLAQILFPDFSRFSRLWTTVISRMRVSEKRLKVLADYVKYKLISAFTVMFNIYP